MSLERPPTDPSEELMLLMGKLQHSQPDEQAVISVPGHLFTEARGMIVQQGAPMFQKMGYRGPHVLFCMHWIKPE